MRTTLPALLLGCQLLFANTGFFFPEDETTVASSASAAEVSPDSFDFFSFDDNDTPALPPIPEGKHLYASLLSKPERLFKGEVFALTFRTVVTVDSFETMGYRFEHARGLEFLTVEPERKRIGHTFRDTFFFKATGTRVRLPDAVPYLSFEGNRTVDSAPLRGSSVAVTVLNPPTSFTGVLAERLKLSHAKTTNYDSRHNIIVLMVDANRSNLEDFRIPNAIQQNFESLHRDPREAHMTYYAVLPDRIRTLHLNYFDLTKQRYRSLSIPIDVEDDTVSTMSDLKPTEHSHNTQKAIFFGAAALVFVLLSLWRRSWIVFLIALGAGSYAAWLSIPLKQVCIKKGAAIYLLPTRNATVFEIAPMRHRLEAQGHIKGYTKIRLTNNKIGWVKDEDTCTY